MNNLKAISNKTNSSIVSSDTFQDDVDALVESIAVHLSEQQRKKFANSLPDRLADMALSVYATPTNSSAEILQQFMQNQHLKANEAKKHIKKAWLAIKSIIGPNEAQQLANQLSSKSAQLIN